MGFVKDLWYSAKTLPDGSEQRVPTARNGKGLRYLAVWLDPDGRERSKAFRVKAAAAKYWRDQESDRDRGTYFDPKAGKVTVGSLAERWLASRIADPSSRIRYEQAYRLHVGPQFGRRAVKAVKPSEVQAWQAELGERYATSTVLVARLVLLGILDLAVDDEAIRKNPARAATVKVPARTDEKIVAWPREVVTAVIDAHPASLRLLPTLGATLGLREAELFGLALEDVDFDEQVVNVRRQVKKIGSSFVFALPKSDHERTVPLSDFAAESIQAHVKLFRPAPVSLPWEKPDGSLRTHNLLLQWIDGGHLKSRNYSEVVWKPAVAAAGIIPEPTTDARGRKRFETTRREGTHQLRHHFASVMLADGVSVKELAEYLGHHDPGFTLRVYSHMLPDSHERARKAIDGRWFRPRAVGDGTGTEQGARP